MEAIAAPAIGAPRPIVQNMDSGPVLGLLCFIVVILVLPSRSVARLQAENAVRAADRRGSTGADPRDEC
jgi:hypothetical protein